MKRVFDRDLLKGTLKAKRITYQEAADAIGMVRDTFSRRLAERGKDFTIGEIHRMMETIPLTMEEVMQIFFKEE